MTFTTSGHKATKTDQYMRMIYWCTLLHQGHEESKHSQIQLTHCVLLYIKKCH